MVTPQQTHASMVITGFSAAYIIALYAFALWDDRRKRKKRP